MYEAEYFFRPICGLGWLKKCSASSVTGIFTQFTQ